MDIYFYKFLVNPQVFYTSKHTYALVNLKPLCTGHVLVVPYRVSALRFLDLTLEESIDYMQTLQVINRFITHLYKADALNIAIQDGPEAGQTIPHLHTHLIPRYKSDQFKGDAIHEELQNLDLNAVYNDFFNRRRVPIDNSLLVHDDDRHPRTPEEMAKEAAWLKQEIDKFVTAS